MPAIWRGCRVLCRPRESAGRRRSSWTVTNAPAGACARRRHLSLIDLRDDSPPKDTRRRFCLPASRQRGRSDWPCIYDKRLGIGTSERGTGTSERGSFMRIYSTAVAVSCSLIALQAAHGQSCLRDSNGDGHPLFGGMINVGGSAARVTSLASGDLNGDGYPDVVMTHEPPNVGAGAISVLLNDGDGLMIEHVGITLGATAAPRSVQLGDLDNDGDLDLVYVDQDADQVVLYRNNGLGQLSLMDSYPVGD